MSSPAAVVVRIKFSGEAIDALQQLTEQAIQNALMRAKDRIYDVAQKYTPVRTGRLAGSFDLWTTARTMVMVWYAKDPNSSPPGYEYAHIVEYGRPPNEKGKMGFPGRYYAETTKNEARAIIAEELVAEFRNMGTVGA